MRDEHIQVVFVVVMALFLAMAPAVNAVGASMGAAAGTDGESIRTELGVEDVQTQSGTNVTIDSVLTRAANEEKSVEVVVKMNASASSFATATDAVTQSSLKQQAADTQATLETYADGRSGVSIVNQFWIANVALVELDTSTADLRELATVDGVVGLHENVEVTTTESATEDLELAEERDEANGTTVDRDLTPPGVNNYTFGLDQINAPAAWEQFDATGEGTSVAVLDTGLDTSHPAFADFDAKNNWAHFNETGHRTGTAPADSAGHGTHVAGTIAGGNESGTHIGVAPEAELYAGAVIPGGSGSLTQVLAGMQWAVSEEVDVISMSLGAPGYTDLFMPAIKNAHDAGTMVVASAGNEGEGVTGAPGNDYNSVSVGASNVDLGIARFSSGEVVDTASAYGYLAPPSWPAEYVVPDIAAPGVEVLSARSGGGYTRMSGTSMAAPHVSGAAALIRSANSHLSVSEVKDALVDGAEKPPRRYRTAASNRLGEADTRYGHGIIDVRASIANVTPETYTVDVTVEDGQGQAMSGLMVDAEGTADAMRSFTDRGGQTSYVLPSGNYTFATETFGYAKSTKTVTVDGNESVTLQLQENVDASVGVGQPDVVDSNSSVWTDIRVTNLKTYTLSLADSSLEASAIEDITLYDTSGKEPRAIAEPTVGETVDVASKLRVDSFDGQLGVDVTLGAVEDGDPALSLDHELTGAGDPITLRTGETETLAEAEPASLSLDAELNEEIDAGDYVVPSISVTNEGDQTAQFDVVLELSTERVSAPLVLDHVSLEGGETVQNSYPVSGAAAFFGPGDVSQELKLVDPATRSTEASEKNTLSIRAAGPVTGTVTNAEGEPVEAAKVRLVDASTNELVDEKSTNAKGQYVIDPGMVPPTEWYLTVQHPQYGVEEIGTPSDGVSSTTNGSVQVIDVDVAAGAEYTFEIGAGEPTAIGVPGVTNQTVGELFTQKPSGVLWAFDAQSGAWTQASVDTELEPLEAIVVVADEKTTATVSFEGPAGGVDAPVPEVRQLSQGWNFVAPSQQAHVGNVFDGAADPSAFLDAFAEPSSPMVHGETLDKPAISLPGDTVENATVNPFSGYFVYANENGSIPAFVYEGVTLPEANELLDIPTTTIEGTVGPKHSRNPVEGARVTLEGTTLGTYTNEKGDFTVEAVPAGTTQNVVVEAGPAFETIERTATAGSEMKLTAQETNYVVTDPRSIDAPDSATVGQQISVTANVQNLGVEMAEDANVQLRIGADVTAPESEIRSDNRTFIVETAVRDIAADGKVQVTLDEEIRTYHPTGEQQLAIATENGITRPQPITIQAAEFAVSKMSISSPATGYEWTYHRGDPVNVTATVTNNGVEADTQDVTYYFDGKPRATKEDVNIRPGESKTLSFGNLTIDADPATYNHSVRSEDDIALDESFRVNPVLFDPEIDVDNTTGSAHYAINGEDVYVPVTVTNKGAISDSQNLTLDVVEQSGWFSASAQDVSDVQNVTLNPGQSTKIALVAPAEDVAWEDFTIEVESAWGQSDGKAAKDMLRVDLKDVSVDLNSSTVTAGNETDATVTAHVEDTVYGNTTDRTGKANITSSNTTVATVENGTIVTHTAGTTTITASFLNETNSTTLTVEASASGTAVTSIGGDAVATGSETAPGGTDAAGASSSGDPSTIAGTTDTTAPPIRGESGATGQGATERLGGESPDSTIPLPLSIDSGPDYAVSIV